MTDSYPTVPKARDRWILERRPTRNTVDPYRPYAVFIELERSESAEIVPVATVLLTNRECPWRCLMCDLWRNTTTETVPAGAIPAQIDFARSQTTAARQIKLYNSGSFFDPHAVPVNDYAAIAERVRGFQRITVESHPALVGQRCLQLRDLLAGQLEVAMGLETAHPEVLEKLNKQMTLEQYERAATFLRANQIALRAFVLVKPPFLNEQEALHWAKRSIDFAFDCRATAIALIPTRPGNGALESLAAQGAFSPPHLSTLEAALAYGIEVKRGRVFADLWDLEKFAQCPVCFSERKGRLTSMNLNQAVLPPVNCACCGP